MRSRPRNGLRYTRDGGFHRSPADVLVTQADEPVLSAAASPSRCLPARFRWGPTACSRWPAAPWPQWASSLSAAGAQLCPEGANRYVAPERCDASDRGDATVHQGALEAANQDAVQGTLELIVMQRQAEMMQKALTVFHTEFNKFATEDLPRV